MAQKTVSPITQNEYAPPIHDPISVILARKTLLLTVIQLKHWYV